MDDSEKLSALIGDIYDATLDPSLWMDVLCKASRFVGGPAASLFSKDATSKTGSLVYGYGIEPRYRQLYFEHYVKLDPLTTAQVFSEIEEPIAMADVIPYDEFLQTRFYREWARPQGSGRFRVIGARQERDQCCHVRRIPARARRRGG